MTITFKGNNPGIKDTILNMLCDSFEERVMKEAGGSENSEAHEK